MDFEIKLIEFLQTNATVGWITFFQIVTMFGSYLGFFIVFVILFLKKRSLSYAFAISFAVASVLNFCLKQIIARERPFVNNDTILNLGNEDGYSMPSGHSMCAGLFATFLFYLILKISQSKITKVLGAITLILFPMLIALSRMVLGVHYLTDTIVGIIVGIIFAIIAIMLYNVIMKKIKSYNHY